MKFCSAKCWHFPKNLTMVKFWKTKNLPEKHNSTVSRVSILRQTKNLTMVKF